MPHMITRNKSIKIRLTDGEHRRLKTLAGKRGISALLRIRALGMDRREEQFQRLAVIAELARARNVLNQIARSCERRPPTDQIEILAQLIRVEERLFTLKPT